MTSGVNELLVSTTKIERSHLHWKRPLRAAVVAGVLSTICLAMGAPHAAIPLVVGAFFTSLADVADPIGIHWRSMSFTAIWITFCAFLGGISSQLGYEELFVVAIVAFCCGIAGVAGPRAAFNGMVSLVTYTIFAGSPVNILTNWENTRLVALGGVIQIAAFVVPVAIFSPRALRSAQMANSPFLSRLRVGFDFSNPFFQHALRLVIAMAFATALADYLQWPHEYWIPMTVAWVSKPDRDGTDYRVVHRFVGTLAGLLVCFAVIDVFGLHAYGHVGLVMVGVFTCLVFVRANYSLSVIGVTMLIVALFSLTGDALSQTIQYRTAATAIGCLISGLAIFVWLAKSPDRA